MNGANNNFSDGEFAFASKGVQSRMISISTFHNLRGGKDRIHPTQKPVVLYEWLLMNYAKEGDKILDTHLGSGSSRIAAYKLGFEFVGCELDKDYFEAQEKRFKQETAQQLLFV
jgi:site-specific DNA-methyltransferase (adenine-specific)